MTDDTFAKNIRLHILKGGEDADMDVDIDTDMDLDVDIYIDSLRLSSSTTGGFSTKM